MKIFQLFEKLYECVDKSYSPEKGGIYKYQYTDSTLSIVIHDEKSEEYKRHIEEIWNTTPKLKDSTTFTVFKEDVFKFLGQINLGTTELTDTMVESFINQYTSVPIKRWKIFKPIYNVTLETANPLVVGPFSIYHIDKHREFLLKNYVQLESFYTFFREETHAEAFLCVEVECRSAQKAEELSLSKYEEFEDIIRFVIGKNGIYDVTVLDYRPHGLTPTYVFSDDFGWGNHASNGKFTRFKLEENILNRNGYSWIWEQSKNSEKSEMQKRIYSSILWVGKGLKEQNISNSFVQYMFALEALFTLQLKGTLVTPSIANQLSEFTAFVLGESLQDRKDVYRKVKRMYDKRSAIAHGRSNNVDETDNEEAYFLLKRTILKLITDEELLKINNIQGLQEWIDERKFS